METKIKGIANNFNGGYLDQDNEWIYYCNPLDDNAGIYRIKKDLSDRVKLFDKNASNISTYMDWMFFSENSTIYRMKKDGTEIKKLITLDPEVSIYEMNIYDNWVYYTDDLPYGNLYKITIEGSSNIKLADNAPRYINIFDNNIYYAGEYEVDECGVYRIDLDGNNRVKLSSRDIECLNVYNGSLYFTNGVNRYGLYNISINEEIETVVSNEKVAYLNIIEDRVYYTNISDSNALYRMNTDGTEKEKLIEDICSNILVFNDYLYFENVTKNEICRMDVNSLDRIIL